MMEPPANPSGFIWYQDGYEIKEVVIDGTLNVFMKKKKKLPTVLIGQ